MYPADFGNTTADIKSLSHVDAMKNRHWKDAMDVEFVALQKNQT